MLGLNEAFDFRVRLPIFLVETGCRRAADDERSPGFVDQNGVHLIDDRKVIIALHLVLGTTGHAVVAQVVESKLRVGAVGDVAVVLLAPLRGVHVIDNATHREAKQLVDGAHPFAVTLSKVVIDGDHMDTPAAQGVEINRQGGDECFTFTSGHFRDAAVVQGHAADELDVVGDHLPVEVVASHMHLRTAKPSAGVFHHGECLGKEAFQFPCQLLLVLDRREAFLPVCRLLTQHIGGHRMQFFLEPVDDADTRLVFPNDPIVFTGEQFA